jgi:hypothetical protein
MSGQEKQRDAARDKRQARIKEIMRDYPKNRAAYESNMPELQRLLAENATDKAVRQ